MGKLRALILPLAACIFLTTAGAQSPNTLQLNTPVERTLGPRQVHEFTVTLEANNFIQLVVEQRGIDVIVKATSPAGKSMGEFDSPNGGDGPEHVSFVGIAAGTYRITVGPLDVNAATTGRYEIKLLELRQANEQEIKASKNQELVKAKGIALLPETTPFTADRGEQLSAKLLEKDRRRSRCKGE